MTRLFPLLMSLALVSCGGAPELATTAETESGVAGEPAAVAPPPDEVSEDAPRVCEHRDANRQAFFGELHIHTSISMDASMFGTRLRPDDSYNFARGGSVELQVPGVDPWPVKLERPLDFAAVTDHASNFGATHLCSTPGTPSYESEACELFRAPLVLGEGSEVKDVIRQLGKRLGDGLSAPAFCGPGGELCRVAASEVWQETQEAAARWNDETDACEFTSFVAYEYTATPELTKVHRNVIFRGDEVPELPISYTDEPNVIEMWKKLRASCNDAGTGCDALAIPHNPNLSNGQMFTVDYGDAKSIAEQAEIAELRESMEPLVEMMQMKGDSECRNDMWKILGGNDELCGFQKARAPETVDCQDGTGKGALGGKGCVSRLDYARYALVEGLREADRIGVNPYTFGFVAATDGHDATPGAVEEWRRDLVIGQGIARPGYNLGGLAGVWAEENTRESLFDAMRRRETFGTSGPRMRVRFFGGWTIPDDRCADPDRVASTYADSVAMGSELSAPVGDAGPVFLVSGMRDPGTEAHPGAALERLQIIKGWAGEDGNIHQQIIEVTGGEGGGVDTATCSLSAGGADALCGVWRDPEFDPAQRAVYYARVVETPSCSSLGWACAQSPSDKRPAACDGGDLETRERAWSSPIWYTPGA